MRRFLLALSFLCAAHAAVANSTIPAKGTIDVAFSPNGGATALVVKTIAGARKSILVQAYSFTSAPIAQALAQAKERGVDVRVILDKSQKSERYTVATYLANHSIPTWIDSDHAIAHNKVMVIDGDTVITGSFNFTKAAENDNAENVIVLRGNPELARIYINNWLQHQAHSDN
ncbi:phospholipase D family protein [Sulfuricystis multivorans]|uniref:phospholipase D family nuclease n=1 Tax=Sulfuricystis multivorans TaxID=2211108 RepID=UPI000F839970|nr:phospholipase D family protein [Sulfuricystis multivorans]